MPTYYLYRHIRHDLNVPFYIGIGEINQSPKFNTDTQIYLRAFAKGGGRMGEFIKKYSSAKEAKIDLKLTTNIANAVKYCNGFTLGYQIFYEYKGAKIATVSVVQKRIGNPILVVNTTKKYNKLFNSVLQASNELNIPYGTISSRLKRGVPYKGYNFKYLHFK